MKKLALFLYFLVLSFSFSISTIGAQGKPNLELEKKANTFFINQNYKSAYPIYLKLHTKNPKVVDYTYKLGISSLFVMDNKEKAIPLLETAAKSPSVEKEVHYYLGRAYMLNYKYNNAIEQFELYKKSGNKLNVKKYDVNRLIEMCNNGKNMEPNITDWNVKDKNKVEKSKILKSYNLKAVAGSLYEKPEDPFFNTSLDYINEQDISTVFENKDSSLLFMSSYGLADEGEGKNIFLVKSLPNGIWAFAQKLPATINSNYDEDYPFMDYQNKTLYFSSKGHNSIGGYDIFKSVYNDSSNTWGTPENMGVPINSPDDDILFVTDSLGLIAQYATAQNCSEGSLNVFKLVNQKKLDDLILIKGSIIPKQVHKIEIRVIDINNCSLLGIYRPNKDLEKYVLVLPNGGKFLFEIKASNLKTQYKVIEVQHHNTFKIFFQEIEYDVSKHQLNVKMYDSTENKSLTVAGKNGLNHTNDNDSILIADITNKNIVCPDIINYADSSLFVNETDFNLNSRLKQGNISPYRDKKKTKKIDELPSDSLLFFSVQVGLFSSVKSPGIFKNIQPLYLKKRDDGNYIHSIGTYETLLRAEEVKYIIRQMGIPDAFVVAFKNGKQIPIEADKDDWELMKKIKDSIETSPIIETPRLHFPELINDTALFYTIQTAIYSASKPADNNILNTKPLFEENLGADKIRYSIGVYNSLELAQYAFRSLEEMGIKNVFITAFYKNGRITTDKAKDLELKGVKTIPVSNNVNVMPYNTPKTRKE